MLRCSFGLGQIERSSKEEMRLMRICIEDIHVSARVCNLIVVPGPDVSARSCVLEQDQRNIRSLRVKIGGGLNIFIGGGDECKKQRVEQKPMTLRTSIQNFVIVDDGQNVG